MPLGARDHKSSNSIQILREASPKIRQQNNELSEVIKSLSKELSPLKDEKRSLDEQNRRLVRSRASMDDENQSIRDSISSLHEQISASRTELKGLQDEQQEHERVREMTERKWRQLTTKLSDKRKEVERLRSRSRIQRHHHQMRQSMHRSSLSFKKSWII